ncbi:Alkaline protease 1 [Colletotrichum higginsianum]|nr:Alkaline protease 1 [Colletotrichum higginsianum]
MPSIRQFVAFLTFVLPALSSPLSKNADKPDSVRNKYIVRVAPGTVETEFESHLSWVATVHKRSLVHQRSTGVEKKFNIGDFKAYSGEFDAETIAKIKKDGHVVAVEPDQVVKVTALTRQSAAPWGVASLSSKTALRDGSSTSPYVYNSKAGQGTFAYVLDSGVTTAHAQFQGRGIKGYNAWPTYAFEDEFGHGTHVAGIIGAAKYGVAKKSTVVDVKIVRGLGYSTVAHCLDGYNWAVNNITNTPGRIAKSVINMSVAFPRSEAMNSAIDAAFDLGVTTVVGAGNDGQDASATSPASAGKAITVGAVAWNRSRSDWSNYGPDVNIFAPGVDIPSLWKELDSADKLSSGTSMATPHVAGLVSYLQSVHSLANAAAVVKKLDELALKGAVGNTGAGSSNALAFNGAV